MYNVRTYMSLMWTNYKFLTKFRFGPIIFFISNLIVSIGIIFLWNSIMGNSKDIVGITKENMISYVIAGRIISIFLFSSLDRRISNDVKQGDYLVNMLHPWDMRYFYLSVSAGQTILHLIWMVIPSIILGYIFGLLNFHIDNISFFISIFLLIIGYINMQLIKLIIGFLSVNYKIGHRAIGSLIDTIIQIAGGLWFPIVILPIKFQYLIYSLPFASMGSIPLLILNGIKLPIALYRLLLIQLCWTLLIWLLSKIILQYYIKTVGNVVN